MISACGLVTLAIYNRLGVILARIRAFHQQKIELLEKLELHESEKQPLLLAMLDSQIAAVAVKARVIQKGLRCLLAAIASFLVCSLFSGASILHTWFGMISLAMGILGVCLFLAGLSWAMRELTLSLTPLEEETAYLEILTLHHLASSQRAKNLKIAESA